MGFSGGGGHTKKLAFEGVGASKKNKGTNIVDRLQIYYKLSFCFKITLDVVFSPLPLSFI